MGPICDERIGKRRLAPTDKNANDQCVGQLLPFCVIATTEALQLLPSWVECVREAEELYTGLTAEYT
jgi:hypothetical protein